jgi:hypothetical protein
MWSALHKQTKWVNQFFFFSGGTEVWTQGFALAKEVLETEMFVHLSNTPKSILLWLFWRWGVSQDICPNWPWNSISSWWQAWATGTQINLLVLNPILFNTPVEIGLRLWSLNKKLRKKWNFQKGFKVTLKGYSPSFYYPTNQSNNKDFTVYPLSL